MKKQKQQSKKTFKSLLEVRKEYFPETLKNQSIENREDESKSYGVILADNILDGIKRQVAK